MLPSDSQPMKIVLGLEPAANGSWVGALDTDLTGPGLLRGSGTDARLKLECAFGSSVSPIVLNRKAGETTMSALLTYSGFPIPVQLERSSDEWTDELHFQVELPAKRPSTVTLAGLPDFWLEEIEAAVEQMLDRQSVVGLAMGIVVDGELFDDRAWGWSDVAQAEPVDGKTLFRWASISKSVTGLLAAKMAVRGQLDLDADVRELVPEFPEKKHVVTTRLLLGHLGGIAHYQHMPRVTRKDYGVAFPFRDAVKAIDMFREALLIHEPGSKYSYSTHGFALAGAVLQRSSDRGFQGEVQHKIAEPLGMSTFEADDPLKRRPQRTLGYRVTNDGRTLESGDTDVSWKLAGGGFHSTVADLARFGAGLCDEDYVTDAERELAWTPLRTPDGKSTGYGFGFQIEREEKLLRISHSGSQRRTRTMLVAFPEERIAIALMCNTEGTNLSGLSNKIAAILLDK
ncbi:MAG: serine beta-lactamase-like protein LACTB [Planctomycetota bacterium]|jgi:serine beta-lactamase-like protein LACTB